MKQYHDHLQRILEFGSPKGKSRNGLPETISLFGYQNRYDLQKGFPILTTKKIDFKNIVVELLWFLRGDNNIRYLLDHSVNIWNEDAYNYYCKLCDRDNINKYTFEDFIHKVQSGNSIDGYHPFNYTLGNCGHQYGITWTDFGSEVDQIQKVVSTLTNTPDSRRHIVTAIDPIMDHDLALYWCHSMFQFNTRAISCPEENGPKYFLDCQLYQRSADMFLGVPYNITSYCLLTHIIAKLVNMIPGNFIHTFGDSHIYNNHLDQVEEILTRDYNRFELPKLTFSGRFSANLASYHEHPALYWFIGNLSYEDFILENYQSYPPIKAKLNTGMR